MILAPSRSIHHYQPLQPSPLDTPKRGTSASLSLVDRGCGTTISSGFAQLHSASDVHFIPISCQSIHAQFAARSLTQRAIHRHHHLLLHKANARSPSPLPCAISRRRRRGSKSKIRHGQGPKAFIRTQAGSDSASCFLTRTPPNNASEGSSCPAPFSRADSQCRRHGRARRAVFMARG